MRAKERTGAAVPGRGEAGGGGREGRRVEAVEEPQLGKEDGPPAAFLASCSAADDHPEGDGPRSQ